ncbi:hypothetical protein [Nocardioides sp.]|uniref:hypothetical protein n=1 Tax=Nocardioides sp. TaxID=35761 RepID=UPI0037832668
MRKLVTALVLVLGLVGLGAVCPAQAARPAPHSARTLVPYAGHYLGRDAHHRTITFSYAPHRGMYGFRVDGHLVGGAHVSGAQWHRTCHHGWCTRGHWITAYSVSGQWDNPHTGGDVHFEVHAIAT